MPLCYDAQHDCLIGMARTMFYAFRYVPERRSCDTRNGDFPGMISTEKNRDSQVKVAMSDDSLTDGHTPPFLCMKVQLDETESKPSDTGIAPSPTGWEFDDEAEVIALRAAILFARTGGR
jgi:hypothetical protein